MKCLDWLDRYIKMEKQWQLQEAKNKFSEVVDNFNIIFYHS